MLGRRRRRRHKPGLGRDPEHRTHLYIYRRVRLYRHHTADCITVVHTNVLLNIQTTIIIENIPMVCPPPVMVVRALASNLRTGQMQLQYTHKPVGWQTRRVI